MNAQYFYDKLMNEEFTGKCRWDEYFKDLIEIHHKGNSDTWYTIYNDGRASIETRSTFDFIAFDDLKGDDFELFSSIQAFASGYIKIDGTKSKKEVEDIMKKLYLYCEPEAVTCDDTEYVFYPDNDIEIQMFTIDQLVKENLERKCTYGLKCFPFNKHISESNHFYVACIEDINIRRNDINYDCMEAIDELMMCITELSGYKCSYLDYTCKYPLYA